MNGTEPLQIKHHSLTGRITLRVMSDAFRAVRQNRGAAGVDRVSIEMFEANLEQNLDRLMRELKAGTFQPLPARRKYIDKRGGKKRPLGIPSVRDRVAHFVILCWSKHRAEEARQLVESCSMRQKSVEKYKDRIRELTVRCHNLDAQEISRINAVIRGVARYFATSFSTVASQFADLDGWTSKRLRCMKLKRISDRDNYRLKNKHLHRMGLISLRDFLPPPDT